MYKMACKKDNKSRRWRQPPSWLVPQCTYIPQYEFVLTQRTIDQGLQVIVLVLTFILACLGNTKEVKNKEKHNVVNKCSKCILHNTDVVSPGWTE